MATPNIAMSNPETPRNAALRIVQESAQPRIAASTMHPISTPLGGTEVGAEIPRAWRSS
jgi:hypothetical protein